ncbi:hypothetical protein [Stutzerimonas kunmingensis]|uniref:hypothetical protein n=1 Tax=Stutzerimonas kunmingensis TaxID=1211807 RepID=UPI0028AB40F6|nr:hypothetical protein [Stutzerimonas kunmingensis]
MSHNIAGLSAEQRACIVEKRREALDRHCLKKAETEFVNREYNRILSGRSSHRSGWRAWALQQLDDIESDDLRTAVKAKLNEFQHSIAGGRI